MLACSPLLHAQAAQTAPASPTANSPRPANPGAPAAASNANAKVPAKAPSAAQPAPSATANVPPRTEGPPESAKHARQADDAYIAGARALERKDTVAAQKHFARALQLDPNRTDYAVALAIARQHRLTQLVQQASAAQLAGDMARSKALLAEAQALDPRSDLVAQHLDRVDAPGVASIGPQRLVSVGPQQLVGVGPQQLVGIGQQQFVGIGQQQFVGVGPQQDSVDAQPEAGAASDSDSDTFPILPAAPDLSNLSGPIQLRFTSASQSFHFRSDVQDVLRRVFAAYGITPTFDSSVLPQSIRIDVDNVDWFQALAAAQMISNTFVVPLDAKSILVLKDTPENRTNYQHLYAETVFLPALTPQQMSDMGNLVRTLFSVKQATVQTQGESLSIRGPKATLDAINLTLDDLLDGGSELLLEMHLYEVDRTRTLNTGLNLPQQATLFNVDSEAQNILQTNQSLINQLIASGAIQAGNIGEEIAALILAGACGTSVLCQPFATFGGGLTQSGLGFSGATFNAALNSSSVRSIDQVQLRVGDHQTATFRSGTRYPIVTSTYSGLGVGAGTPTSSLLASLGLTQQQLSSLGLSNASAALNTQPIPQVQYEDLGLTLTAKPIVQRTGEVSLHFDLKLEALSGASLDGNPVLVSRQFTSDITVKEGSSAVIASSMSKTESTALSGLPGFAELPGFFDNTLTDNNNQVDTEELVMVVTPHIVRRRRDQLASPMLMLPLHEIPGS